MDETKTMSSEKIAAMSELKADDDDDEEHAIDAAEQVVVPLVSDNSSKPVEIVDEAEETEVEVKKKKMTCASFWKLVFKVILYLLFWPLLLLGMFQPFIFIMFNLFSSFYFFCYKTIFSSSYREEFKMNRRGFWHAPLTRVAKFYRFLGRVYHGQEMHGLENIPLTGPTILILYHAQIPVDAPFVLTNIFLELRRNVVTIVDRLVYKIPGYRTFLEAAEQQSGTVESCTELMNNGELLAIYPGGTREGCLATNRYEILWPKRAGFAKVAHASRIKPTIIPIFTQNCRNAFGSIGLFKKMCQRQYIKNKVAMTPLCGWFPVKLISHIGKKIEYDENSTVEEIVERTKESMKNLIDSNQRIPGSIWQSFLDRFRKTSASS